MVQHIRILLVEDDLPDVRWFQLVLQTTKLEAEVCLAPNGQTALSLLERAHGQENLPDVIFLDLNLPAVDGSEVLNRIKSDTRFENIPVCVLTGSDFERHRLTSRFGLPEETYILKPLNREKLQRAIRCFPQLESASGRLASSAGGLM